MPIRSIEITDTYVELNNGGETIRFYFADFPPSAGTNEARQEHVRQHLQEWFDHRIKLKDLPDDDPDKITDPARPDFFHEGTGGNAELVARPVIVESVSYDDTKTPPLEITLRRARRG